MTGSCNHNYAWNLTAYLEVNIPYCSPLDSEYPSLHLGCWKSLPAWLPQLSLKIGYCSALPERILPSYVALYHQPQFKSYPRAYDWGRKPGKTNYQVFLISIAGHRLYFPPGAIGQVIFQLYNWTR